MSSLAKFLQDVGFVTVPDVIVGCRYQFGTTWNGSPLLIEGLIEKYVWQHEGRFFYTVSSDNEELVRVIGVMKDGVDWLLQVKIERAVIGLQGNFSLV
jgi:hypothetical protein